MPSWQRSIVARSSVRGERTQRLDAEYWDETGSELETRLRRIGASPLRAWADLAEEPPSDPLKALDAESTVNYLEITDVDLADGMTFPDAIKVRDAPGRARLAPKIGDVLVSKVRPARNAVALVGDRPALDVASNGFAVLRTRSDQLTGIRLFLWLKTRFARVQLSRRARASMYPAVDSEDILDALVVPLDERSWRAAETIYRAADKARTGLLDAKKQGDELIEAHVRSVFGEGSGIELGGVSVIARKDAIGEGSATRLDAEFFSPHIAGAVVKLEALGSQTLGDLYGHRRASTGKTPAGDAYTDEADASDLAFVKVGSLTNLGINWAAVEFASVESKKFAKGKLKGGEIVFTASAHSAEHIGRKVDLVDRVPTSLASRLHAVGELMILGPSADPVYDIYVASYLRTGLGRALLRRCVRGITSHVYAPDVCRWVLVPPLDAARLKTLAELHTQVIDARLTHIEAVARAVQHVEDAVDGIPQ